MSTLNIQIELGPQTTELLNKLNAALVGVTLVPSALPQGGSPNIPEGASTGGGAKRPAKAKAAALPKDDSKLAPEPTPVSDTDAPATPSPGTPIGEELSSARIRAVLKRYAEMFGRDKAIETLSKYDNATNVSTLDEKHYPAVYSDLNAQIAENA